MKFVVSSAEIGQAVAEWVLRKHFPSGAWKSSVGLRCQPTTGTFDAEVTIEKTEPTDDMVRINHIREDE